jgi:predicted transglutaminase-like cysteine proteinase
MRIAGIVIAVGLGWWAAAPAAALVCTPCRATPAPVRPPPVRTSDYQPVNVIGGVKDVFNDLADLPKWNRVRQLIAADTMRADPRLAPWVAWAEGLRGQTATERLNAINQRVNQRLRYVLDQVADGVPDYWQSPLETVNRGTGDCEDYAILKYYLALHAGISHDDLALVIGRVASTGELHAVLVARAEGGWRLLDNRTNTVIDLGGRADFGAIYFVDVNDVWVPVARPAARR